MAGRRICVVTGSRAEYGLLFWLLEELKEDPSVALQIAVTGMHLSPEFGLTYQQIEADGFTIDARIEMLVSGDSPAATAKSVGLGVIGFADAFERLRPDLVVVLGDRFEIFAAVEAAMIARVPIAHLHGGESSEASIDEAIRHSVTKMAALHFTAAERYRERVIQLGEAPERVFNVGALGLDGLTRLPLLSGRALEEALEFSLGSGPVILCTYHPVTLDGNATAPLDQLFAALDTFPAARVIITKANADSGGRVINRAIDEYASANSDRVKAFTSLGQLRYLSLLVAADVVVGNSSSGIIEAPAAKTPTVNIGDRQRGRMKAPSIIDCGEMSADIQAAIGRALTSEFQHIAGKGENLFGSGGASRRIAQIIRDYPLKGILQKKFHEVRAR